MKKLLITMLTCMSFIFCLNVNADTISGDVSGDDIISARDALAVLKHVADLETIDEADIEKADVNQDKRITAEDALHILKYAAGIIESFDDVIVNLEQGLVYPHEKYDVVASEVKIAEEETVKVISSYEEYENLLNQYGDKLTDMTYSEEYFEENSLLCAVHRFPSGDFFDMTLEKIILADNNASLYMNAFGPGAQSEVEAYWTVFIPVKGKEWSNYTYSIYVEDYVNSTMCNGVGAEHSSAYRTKNIAGQKDITILSTYEEYLDYYKKYNNNIVVPEIFWYDRVLLGCKKEFFDNNSIIVASYTEISGSIDIKCESFVEKDGDWFIYIDRQMSDGDVMTDDLARWEIMIPVEGKDWAYKNISIAETEDNIVDADYANVQVISAYCGDHNEDYIPRIRLISSYADYEAYIEPIKEKLDVHYDETYFEDNILIVVDYTEGDYDTEVYFKNIEYLENEGVYQINIENKSSLAQSPMPRPWEIIIPFEGKSWTLDDFKVINTNITDVFGWALQSSRANPVEGYRNIDYPIVLDSYEEYQNYIELFKKANPDYVLKKEYTEADFEEMDLVVGGFWTSSGQLELTYENSTLEDGKININFDGKCPSVCTDDTYYYHFMISFGFINADEYDINWNVDVEYY